MADKKVIAVTTIHRATALGKAATKDSPAVKPVIQVIQAGTIFLVDEDEFAELSAVGAIRVPDKDEKVQVDVANIVPDGKKESTVNKKAAPAAKTTPTPASKPATSSPSSTGLGGDKSSSGDADLV